MIGISKNCGIQTDLLVNIRNGWKEKLQYNRRPIGYKKTVCQLKKKKKSECRKHRKEFWYSERLPCAYEKWLSRKLEEKKK